MEMHSQEWWLPADNGACVAAMTLKSQKTHPKFFQDFQSSNQHGTGKIAIFLKPCVLWARFPVRRDVLVELHIVQMNGYGHKGCNAETEYCLTVCWRFDSRWRLILGNNTESGPTLSQATFDKFGSCMELLYIFIPSIGGYFSSTHEWEW